MSSGANSSKSTGWTLLFCFDDAFNGTALYALSTMIFTSLPTKLRWTNEGDVFTSTKSILSLDAQYHRHSDVLYNASGYFRVCDDGSVAYGVSFLAGKHRRSVKLNWFIEAPVTSTVQYQHRWSRSRNHLDPYGRVVIHLFPKALPRRTGCVEHRWWFKVCSINAATMCHFSVSHDTELPRN